MRKRIQKIFVPRLRSLARKTAKLLQQQANPMFTRVVSLRPKGKIRGVALVAHLVEGVTLDEDDPVLRTHNHFLEAKLIASCLLDRDYAVDFISYLNPGFIPRKHYDLFISARTYFAHISARLNADCIKIVHLDTNHWLQNNRAALDRLIDVRTRRGVALRSYTPIEHNHGIESADVATLLGNKDTYRSYAFANKAIFQIPNPGTTTYSWDDTKDFDACRNRFIWLGSSGLVHKGLDLALEAFASMPDLHLTVCGPIEKDRHFVDAFRKELYETPNIHAQGWVDITSTDFASLAKHTVAHVYPTCADACCGSVVNCMHAGLIPVVTPQAGVDIDPSFGLMLSGTNVDSVRRGVRAIAELPTDKLAAMALATHEEARRVYSRERYREVFGSVIDRILACKPGSLNPGFFAMETAGSASDYPTRPTGGMIEPH